ncbi:hypothetical protein H9Q72_003112 [Fusarium xylarioides]|uniref:Uncharacterized protein n=1 Tax=Fusarium xylarioides TaxID=221167 RepID=A0A9P7I495_9HYPO|nr:hypothetical protein H9Q72_003112 [Fusarium xylarioides]
MAPALAAAVTVPVGDVVAMSDAELAHFIQTHRLPDGDYDLPVDGWDKLSKEERSRLAERLEAQKRGLAQSPTACSRPLDLDDLNARLRQVSPKKSFLLRPEPQAIDLSGTSTPPLDPEAHRTRHEIEAYHELINDGGRPSYSIDLVREAYRDPDKYAEILRPWQETLTQIRAEGIFGRQLQRWQDFRKWQNDNRGHEDNDGGFLAYVEQKKRWIKQDCLPRSRARRLAEIEADPSCLRPEWDQTQLLRRRQRRLYREHGCRGFCDYAGAVKRRLARHDFTQPFKLDKDPKKQDKLTTWIEYLNYEYWWLDKHISDIERLEPEHDKLWQELVDDKILRPHETKEFVRTMASPMERAKERERAQKAVERAESEAKRIYALTQKDPKRLRIPKAERILMLKHGTEELLAAKRRFEQIRSRNDRITEFIRGTFSYAGAKRDAARHRVLVQWVLDQVPLIEAEMNPSKANGPGTVGRRTAKRKRTDEEPPERQSPKKVRVDLQEPRLTGAKAPSKATEARAEPGVVMDQEAAQGSQPKNPATGCVHQDDVHAMPQGPRRSPRIAARRDDSRVAVEPNIFQPRSRSKSEATSAQPRVSHSPIQETKAHTARRQSRSNGQGGIAKTTRKSRRCRQRRRG